jgi:hypothetical protein
VQIEVDYRLEDLEELYIPETYAARPSQWKTKMRTGVGGWLAFVAASLAFWYILRSRRPYFPRPLNPPRDLQTDIFTLVLPGALVLLFTTMMLFRLWRVSRWKPKTPSTPPGTKNRKKRICAVLIWFAIAAIAFACINGAWSRQWRPSRAEIYLLCWGPWLLTLILLIARTSRMVLWQARKTWLTTPGFARHHTFELDDWGMKLWNNLTRIEMHWTTVTRARETQNLLVLVSETKLQYIIPKRAFATEADIESARALLQNKLQNTTFLAQPLGFPMAPKPVQPLAMNP